MAITASTQIANRYGVDLVFHDVSASTTTDDITVDFANEVSIEINGGEPVFATGGQGHKRLIGFEGAIEGSMTISTQIITPELLKLIAADSATGTGAVFKSSDNDNPIKYYKITGTTAWKDADGAIYTETITAYKAMVRKTYNPTYSGDGDPHSVDITIDLFEDDTNGMISFSAVAAG